VLHLSASRRLILKAESLPRIGDKVIDEHLKPVGSVADIIGPVSSPYVSVKPIIPEPEHLAAKTLYTIPSIKGRKGKKRNGR
jgi:rRNA processing protein Gar1